MQSEQNEGNERTATGQASSPDAEEVTPAVPAVQGVPWWGGVGQQGMHTLSSSPAGAFHSEHPNAGVTAVQPFGVVHAMQQKQGITQSVLEDSTDGGSDDSQTQSGTSAAAHPSMRDYVLPYTQLELGHSMAVGAYPYVDPYYGGMIATYGPHAMMYPHMYGIHQSRMPLPSEITEEEPVYVNAKQYKGIMRRRRSRAKAESENRLAKLRKPYLHESRHLHAMRRVRGCGGRFLNTKSVDDAKANSDSTRSSEGQSSQGGTTPDSKH